MAKGLLKAVCGRAVDNIANNVAKQHASIFGRSIPSPKSAPYDLRDSEGDYCVSSDGTPLIQLLKVSGTDCEIAYGSASLSDTALIYAHPFLTFFAMGLTTVHLIGLRGFIVLQLLYAVGALALLGRSWKYVMRPTVAYTLGLTTIQIAASMFLGDFAVPIVAIASALIIGRPFVEQFLNNQDGSNRPFKLSKAYERPTNTDDWTKREAQIKEASATDAGPVMILGTALGRFKAKGDAMAPDEGMPMGISTADCGKGVMLLGKPGSGKTGAMLPLAQQWLGLGTIEDGMFKNAGGALYLCGKGVLARDLIGQYRKDNLDQHLKIRLISPMPGESRMALLKGMTPNMIANALQDLNTVAGSSNIWTSAAGDRIRKAATLLEAAVVLEKMEMEKRAKTRGFSDHAAWLAALDKTAQDKKRTDGTSWGFESAKHYQDWRLQNGLAADPQIVEATRRFYWTLACLFDYVSDWIGDSMFLTGQPPAGNQTSLTAQNAPLMTHGSSAGEAAKVQASAAPTLPGGFVAWLQNHPALLAGNSGHASVLNGALTYAVGLLSMRAELVQDVRWTAAMWIAPAMEDKDLREWADLEDGADAVDVTDCLRGSVIGLEIPEERYGQAGAIITALAKKRVFDAMKTRPTKWRDDPQARPVMVMMDEVHLLMGSNKNSDESTMASIGRSLGLCLVMATQSREELDGRMGQSAMTALLNNFASIIVFQSAEDTMAWANAFLRTQWVTKYTQNVIAYFKENTKSDYVSTIVEGPARDRLHRALRYKLTHPVGVKLTNKDREALQNEDDKSGSIGMSIMMLAWMFSIGLITNVAEAGRGTFSMIGRLFKHGFRAFGQATTGGLRAPDDYTPPGSGMTAKREQVELFPVEDWAVLEMQYTAVMSIDRGKHPRRDIVRTIGPLSLEMLEGIADKQPGVMTIYRAMNEGLLKQAA